MMQLYMIWLICAAWKWAIACDSPSKKNAILVGDNKVLEPSDLGVAYFKVGATLLIFVCVPFSMKSQFQWSMVPLYFSIFSQLRIYQPSWYDGWYGSPHHGSQGSWLRELRWLWTMNKINPITLW
jgi:hypothetical protein